MKEIYEVIGFFTFWIFGILGFGVLLMLPLYGLVFAFVEYRKKVKQWIFSKALCRFDDIKKGEQMALTIAMTETLRNMRMSQCGEEFMKQASDKYFRVLYKKDM